MPQQNIAVIGAGPKAAAIAAKAYCLQQEGVPIRVSVFERAQIGAYWSGNHGYTDGVQRLCTPAERDLGFPYEPTFQGNVTSLMQSRFSWSAYLVSQAKKQDRYAEWVNRGRRPPKHEDFTKYLSFAIDRAKVTPLIGRVTKLINAGGTWSVRMIEAGSRDEVEYPGYHGVVMTGPGPAAKKPPQVKDERVLSGVDFWTHRARVHKLLTRLKNDQPIVIVGGGGTAAAITAWFVREGVRTHPIVLLNNQAMLFTRTTNFFENSLFDDDETWKALKPAERSDFTRRLNRGVVWETVTNLLSDAQNLKLLPGSASAIRHVPTGTKALPDLEVEYKNAQGTHSLSASIVIDATGFDPWAFEKFMPGAMRMELADDQRKDLMGKLRDDLSLPLDAWPRVHVPNLADAIGPGFGSLMVLGATADRILGPYYEAAKP